MKFMYKYLDAEMANAVRYEFEVASDGGLIDSKSKVIAARELPTFLEANRLDKAGYIILWLTGKSAPVDTIKDTIAPFGSYGFTKIVVRVRPGETPVPPANVTRPKTLVLAGKPDQQSVVAGMPFPNLSGRPPELRPEPLPLRVRYKFTSDKEMIESARKVAGHLLEGDGSAQPLFQNGVMLQPGAWDRLKDKNNLGKNSAKPVFAMIKTRTGDLKLTSMSINDPSEAVVAEASVREMILSDGGGHVRALKASEMSKWWTFISFDIIEPTLVVETTGGKYLFILELTSKGFVTVDELNGLPNLPQR